MKTTPHPTKLIRLAHISKAMYATKDRDHVEQRIREVFESEGELIREEDKFHITISLRPAKPAHDLEGLLREHLVHPLEL